MTPLLHVGTRVWVRRSKAVAVLLAGTLAPFPHALRVQCVFIIIMSFTLAAQAS
jgi:hypothetical protein